MEEQCFKDSSMLLLSRVKREPARLIGELHRARRGASPSRESLGSFEIDKNELETIIGGERRKLATLLITKLRLHPGIDFEAGYKECCV
jgi:hypothetical protein